MPVVVPRAHTRSRNATERKGVRPTGLPRTVSSPTERLQCFRGRLLRKGADTRNSRTSHRNANIRRAGHGGMRGWLAMKSLENQFKKAAGRSEGTVEVDISYDII